VTGRRAIAVGSEGRARHGGRRHREGFGLVVEMQGAEALVEIVGVHGGVGMVGITGGRGIECEA
jgi:hypothetical protein